MFILVCIASAVVLFALELVIPSHGVLGFLASIALLTGVGACFWVDRWLGLGLLVTTVALAPLAFAGAMKIWPKTPVGKKFILQPIDSPIARPRVAVGQVGFAVSELRPSGMAEFDGHRVEVACEHGMLTPGTGIRIVSFENNRPIVVAIAS